MPIYVWMIMVVCIASTAWGAFAYLKREERLTRTQKKLQETLLKLHHIESETLQTTALREGKEEKLRGYLQLMDTLINTIPNPIYFKDANGVFQGCNNVFAKYVLGLKRDRIIGVRPQDLPDQIPPDLAASCQRQEIVMAQKGGIHTFEAQVQCADGNKRDFLFSLAPLWNQTDQSMGSVSVLSDLTDKNRAADDRLQKEKLQGVLETAGGVCHEFNQPLQALSGYLELLAAKINAKDEIFSYIEKALTQIERMRTITAKLQGITHYESMHYADKTKIIDIHKSSR